MFQNAVNYKTMKKTRTYRVKRIIRNTFAGKLNLKMGNYGRRCILRSCVAAFVWDFYNVNHLIDFLGFCPVILYFNQLQPMRYTRLPLISV